MNDGLLKNINFWVFSVGLKLVPCILLTYLSLALIRVLLEAEKRRQRLKSNVAGATSHVSVATADGSGLAQAPPVVSLPAAQQPQPQLRQQAQQRDAGEGELDERRGSNRSEASLLK